MYDPKPKRSHTTLAFVLTPIMQADTALNDFKTSVATSSDDAFQGKTQYNSSVTNFRSVFRVMCASFVYF